MAFIQWPCVILEIEWINITVMLCYNLQWWHIVYNSLGIGPLLRMVTCSICWWDNGCVLWFSSQTDHQCGTLLKQDSTWQICVHVTCQAIQDGVFYPEIDLCTSWNSSYYNFRLCVISAKWNCTSKKHNNFAIGTCTNQRRAWWLWGFAT